MISECVSSLVSQDYPADRLDVAVIADNCSDATAARARSAGAKALERHDTQLRGKPRAIAWALAQLPVKEFDAVVIIDADSTVDRDFSRALAAESPLQHKAVQAYFGTLNEYENWLTRLGGVLARCRYEVTYPLKRAAGLNCPLTGNGMCLGRELVRDGRWHAFSLTENWELYARYSAEGIPIGYARNAMLRSQEARSLSQGTTQRSRWLAGRMRVLREWGGRILRSSRVSLLQKLDTLTELAGLSPVLHLTAALFVIAAAALVPGSSTMASVVITLAAISLAAPVLTTLAVIVRHPQPWSTMAAFARLPFYAAWRIVVAARTLLLPRDLEWRKTDRHAAG
jgi:1,2-diacylglycerol 3-beta-glucosyltransferase